MRKSPYVFKAPDLRVPVDETDTKGYRYYEGEHYPVEEVEWSGQWGEWLTDVEYRFRQISPRSFMY